MMDYDSVLNYLSMMSDDKRLELFEQAARRHKTISERTSRRYEDAHASAEHAVDYASTKWFGDRQVYMWVNGDNEIFYIGKGRASRVVSLYKVSRTKSFFDMAGKNPRAYIIAQNVNDKVACDIEKMLMWTAQICNEPITNAHDIIEPDIAYEMWCILNGKKDLACCYPGTRAFRKKYNRFTDSYADELKSFFRIQKQLHERSCVPIGWHNDVPRFEVRKHSNNGDPLKTWTVDGITKPCRTWCRLYNVSYGAVVGRMNTRGIGVGEALRLVL